MKKLYIKRTSDKVYQIKYVGLFLDVFYLDVLIYNRLYI